jgi:hypothetical protein
MAIRGSISDLNNVREIDMNFTRSVKYIFYSFLFIRPILLILALTGLFIRNVGGWILMNAFFYFLTFEYIFVHHAKNSDGLYGYLSVLIVLIPVFISNLPQVRRQYNVNRNWIVNANLATLCLGLVSAFIQGYLVVHHSTGPFEIFEKLN